MSTIVAISTPGGRGALGVIRLSGSDSLEIITRLAGDLSHLAPRRASLQSLIDPQNGEILDQALVTYFKAPNSFTGEDVIELSCHGSPVVLRRIVELTLAFGARLADPGEFTLRALTNGKVNLAQAEAVRDLISSRTEAAARQAARQLSGELTSVLQPFKDKLIEVIVLLESALEFVEDDLPPPQRKKIGESIAFILVNIERLALSYSAGHLLQDGISVAIIGAPNVGKSSLFNRLLTRQRAIVTDIPGTTRDTLSEPVDIGGVPVLLTDTAGLRDSPDAVETLGIERAHRTLSDADLVLVVLDSSAGPGSNDLTILSRTNSVRRLIVLNKSDLPGRFVGQESWDEKTIRVSALTGDGIEDLQAAILTAFELTTIEPGGLLVTNARHYDLLRHAQTELRTAESVLAEGASEEMLVVPLHNALRFLGEITGETTTEQILSVIFSTFCIGK